MQKKTPTTREPQSPDTQSARPSGDIADFIAQVNAMSAVQAPGTGKGRLLFALDATMSRQPTWDLACQLQAEMFEAVADIGALDVQLIYFRGFGECRSSRWVGDARALAGLMSGIDCRGGHTQISKIFSHTRAEHNKERINAVVYVGDAMEEDIDRLAQKAGELGLLGCPMFLFQEGHDPVAETAFREFARLTKGAYARFDASAPKELAALLRAVAAYATGGRKALQLQKSAPTGAGVLMRGRLGPIDFGGGMSSPNTASSVKSRYLSMTLDHDTGSVSGTVRAGLFAGKDLASLSAEECWALYDEIGDDPDSLALFESWLDANRAGWRDWFAEQFGMDTEREDRAGGAQATSGLSGIEEAYEVLGLKPGATPTQIRAAHRALMKKVHPDAGGSVFLAAKINEAKDLLLKESEKRG